MNERMVEIGTEINAAIQAVLAQHKTDGVGCEFHGELYGILQQVGHPESGVGWSFKVGNGLPERWGK